MRNSKDVFKLKVSSLKTESKDMARSATIMTDFRYKLPEFHQDVIFCL